MFFSVITKGLRQSLAAESPLKMMKMLFISILKILKCLSWRFGHAEKQFD